MERRNFLVRTGLGLGAAAFLPSAVASSPTTGAVQDWGWVRNQFNLSRDVVQLAGFFLASHPAPVREAIERHRRGLDENAIHYVHENNRPLEAAVLKAAGEFLGARPVDIALTNSTTMGLGLLYSSLALKPGHEILTTAHDHYATDESLRYRAERTGATVRRATLYTDPAKATAEQMVDALLAAVTPKTRVVAITWVHSVSGVKLPVRRIADALSRLNAERDEADRALLCVDGVHGLGNQDVTVADLGCDFLIAGTHKWIYGPRGTGLVWGTDTAWRAAHPTIPTFSGLAYPMWTKDVKRGEIPMATLMTPGGFHAFEHRWAAADAFTFCQQIGKRRIQDRVHALNRQFKEGLSSMPKVTLRTPMSEEISAGIVCYEVEGHEPMDVVGKLYSRGITSSVTPYATKYARASFAIINGEDDVERALKAIREVAAT